MEEKGKIFFKLKRAFFQPAQPETPVKESSPLVETVCEDDALEVAFARNFIRRGGNFVYCADEKEFHMYLRSLVIEKGWIRLHCMEEGLKNALEDCGLFYQENVNFTRDSVCITTCEYMDAKNGWVIFSSHQAVNTRMTNGCTTQVVLAKTSQVIKDEKDAYTKIISKYFNFTPPTVFTYKGKKLDEEGNIQFPNDTPTDKEIYLFLVDDTGY